MAGVAALAVAFAVPASSVASSTTTFVTRSDGKLAFAAWQLNDAYNTSIQVGGNDLMFLNAGGYNQPGVPAYHVNGVLLTVNQDFCDTTTDEEVFRELSVFPDVGANVAMVNDALNRASVIGTLDLSGIEVRTPNCAAPDYGQRSFSFPTFPVQLNLRWDAPKGNNTVNSHFEIHYPDYCGMFLMQVEGISGFVDASVSGTITSSDLHLGTDPLPTPWVSFLAHYAQLQAQVSVCTP